VPVITVLVLLFTLTPLACWLPLARTRVIGTLVGLVLAGYTALVVGVTEDWLTTRAKAEIYVCYAPFALLIITAGVLLERRLRGPRPKGVYRGRTGGAWVALAAHLAFFGLVGTPSYLMFLHDDFTPSTNEVLPLPHGLTVLELDGGGCGSGTCGTGLEVGSSTGLPGDQIAALLRTELTDRGWQLDSHDSGCRHNGWLLDHRPLCVSLNVSATSVSVDLEGGADYS
jgi:hypothetical protein